MSVVRLRTPSALTLALAGLGSFLVAVALAAASPGASSPRSSARAVAIQVIVPGAGGATPAVSAPPDTVAPGGGFAYPGDGSAVSSGAVTAGAFAPAGAPVTATAEVNSLSLFGGEITAASIIGRAKAQAVGGSLSGDVSASQVSGLVVAGQAVGSSPGARVAAGDWGYVSVLEQSLSQISEGGSVGYRASVTALRVQLTAEHGGLPAGSQIVAGFAEATARPTAAPVPRRAAPRKARATGKKPSSTKTGKRDLVPPEAELSPLLRREPPDVRPQLTAGGYVFPVYGPSSFADTFGAPRAHVAWHHGEDIFAPLGAPVLAVADGRVFSVGWNRVGGFRLWLQDRQGNEFYYAHLSAYSLLAVNGRDVKAGDVLGFVGNTGDAEGTPYHLHFEIHPVQLQYLDYDGVVPPYSYLLGWQRLEDVPFAAVAGWAPGFAATSTAPRPGAILLQVADISTASGLDPGSLERALAASRLATADGVLRGAGAQVVRPPRRLTRPPS
jgi:murein DD-endopeptidase MepM/ murein hydrolase activator NlpD